MRTDENGTFEAAQGLDESVFAIISGMFAESDERLCGKPLFGDGVETQTLT